MPQEVSTENLPNPNGPLPLADYIARINGVIQEPSKKGSCMDALECEILSPDVVPGGGGTEVMAAGRKFTLYMPYSLGSLFYAKQNLAKLGITLPGRVSLPTEDEVKTRTHTRVPEIQDETLLLRGKTFGIRLSTKPRFKTDTGKWDGKPMLDANGQPEIVGHDIDAKADNITGLGAEGPY